MAVLDRFFEGDQSALAKIISYIEDREDGYQKVLARIFPKAGTAVKLGFTGPPGAGKSSLVNNVARELASRGHKVAIVAVDPTSPFTGGALLGDRVRLTNMPADGSVYIRSMATRGSTGGLAAATGNVTTALDAFGFDYILIETVGVGQVELDIIDTCDTVVVVLVPESGDAVQALKAGLMEIADIFDVNKADRPGSENIIAELNMILDMKRKQIDWKLPVVDTVATKDKGTDNLLDEIASHLDYKRATGLFEEHRKRQIEKKIYQILQYHINNIVREKVGDLVNIDKLVQNIYERKNDPYTAVDELLSLSDFTAEFARSSK